MKFCYFITRNIFFKSFLLLILLALNTKSYAQYESCDKYLDFIYDYSHILKSDDFKQSFSSYFFDSTFEQQVKNNKTGLSFTVPLSGIPVTFGGNNESADAWQKRTANMGSTKWDFSNVTKEDFDYKMATTESREVWLHCIQSFNPNKFTSSYIATNESVLCNFAYDANLLDKAPVYSSFTCMGGLSCTLANVKYKGKKMKKGTGESIKFKWANNGEATGVVTLNTSEGSITIKVVRDIQANMATLSYISSRLGDMNHPNEITKIQSVPPFQIVAIGVHNTKSNDSKTPCEYTSHDGWCGKVNRIDFTAPSQTVYMNFQAPCTEIGRTDHACAFKEVLSTTTNGPTVGFTVAVWCPSANFLVSYDIYELKIINSIVSDSVPIVNNLFTVAIPKDCFNPSIRVSRSNNQSFTFDSNHIPATINLVTTTEDGNKTKYTFKLNTL
jgi:hypothetical protein